MLTVGILYPAVVCCRYTFLLYLLCPRMGLLYAMRGLFCVVRSYCMGNAKASARGMDNK